MKKLALVFAFFLFSCPEENYKLLEMKKEIVKDINYHLSSFEFNVLSEQNSKKWQIDNSSNELIYIKDKKINKNYNIEFNINKTEFNVATSRLSYWINNPSFILNSYDVDYINFLISDTDIIAIEQISNFLNFKNIINIEHDFVDYNINNQLNYLSKNKNIKNDNVNLFYAPKNFSTINGRSVAGVGAISKVNVIDFSYTIFVEESYFIKKNNQKEFIENNYTITKNSIGVFIDDEVELSLIYLNDRDHNTYFIEDQYGNLNQVLIDDVTKNFILLFQ